MSIHVAIVYYSATGTLQAMAERLEQAALSAGATVRRRHVREIAPREAIESRQEWADHVAALADEPVAEPDDVVWADVVLLGSPTRFGNVTSQFQAFIDTLGPHWSEGELADKVYAGFTSSQTAHGGQESTLLSIYRMVAHFGGLVVAPGYTDPGQVRRRQPVRRLARDRGRERRAPGRRGPRRARPPRDAERSTSPTA